MVLDMLLLNTLGAIATGCSILMWVPQARTTWQNRNDATRLAGVSETTQWLTMVGALLWAVFGLLSASFWVAAPSAVSFPLALATIVVVRRGRRLPDATVSVPIIEAGESLDAVHEFVPAEIEPVHTSTVPVAVIPADEPLSVSDLTSPIPVISAAEVPTAGTTASVPIVTTEPVAPAAEGVHDDAARYNDTTTIPVLG